MAEIPKSVSLHGTTNAMTWAEEFVRIFKGHVVGGEDGVVDEGLMVGWFANAMETALTHNRASLHAGTWHAFVYFYNLDCSNAAFHCAEVRYSPITFRLAEFIQSITHPATEHPERVPRAKGLDLWDDHRLSAVLADAGAYAEDPGR